MSVEVKDKEKLQQVADKALEWIRYLESSWEKRRDQYQENYRNYHSIYHNRYYHGRANIFVPMSFQVVESFIPALLKGMYATNPNFDLQPVDLKQLMDPDEIDGTVDRVKAMLHFEQQKKIRIIRKHIDFLRNMGIYGRGYMKVFWRREKEVRPVKSLQSMPEKDLKDNFNGNFTQSVNRDEVEVTTYDGVDMLNVDPMSIMVDPSCADGDIQRARCVVEIWNDITADEVIALTKVIGADGKPVFEISPETMEHIKNAGRGDPLPDDGKLDQRDDDKTLDMETGLSPVRRLSVHELHWDIEIDGTMHRNGTTVIVDRKWIVRHQRNPYHHGLKPYLSCGMYQKPNEFDATSLLDPIRRLQYELNDTRNQAMDYKSMALNVSWLVGATANYKLPSMTLGPGKVIRVADVSQVVPIQLPQIQSLLAQSVENQTERDIRGASGALMQLQGLQSGKSETASEAIANLQQANARIDLILRELEEMLIIPGLEMQFELNKQFVGENRRVRSIEPVREGISKFGAGIEVSPFDLVGKFDFFALGTSKMQIDALKNRQLLDFFQIASRLPPSPQNVNLLNGTVKKIWQDTFGFSEAEFDSMMGGQQIIPGQGSLAPDNVPGMEGAAGMGDVAQLMGQQGRDATELVER